uniref:Uncharacterized protein n=1 Tax=Chromera velia CCMP2878 TaxID=1169474 RepID=A0A0G4EZG1_9ALVE|eukprot:Cvel_14292.t1-p1 / transcript=Cvel_14292.t1 / gene=Cvel_14292 / organism=Chromera_velia_CCMP2878 / gene_product=hypothetical protein / transcript_product=hypothetical protein / location=Cvel_scaffold1009:47543-47845(+) / protein_length=101 / sequence_SO=supercontig / SO=protein_coding / is_pseudo=false
MDASDVDPIKGETITSRKWKLANARASLEIPCSYSSPFPFPPPAEEGEPPLLEGELLIRCWGNLKDFKSLRANLVTQPDKMSAGCMSKQISLYQSVRRPQE